MVVKFFTFELDAERRELHEKGTLISLPPKAFDVLCYLVQHRDRMVPKSELLDVFWSLNVSESALQKTISLVRRALRADGQELPLIKTYHGLGFRFESEVQQPAAQPVNVEPPQPSSLREQRFVGLLCIRICPQEPPDGTANRTDARLESFLKIARGIVRDHRGALLRITRDGFVADFGLSQHCEDGARRALHCAVAISGDAQSPAEEISDIQVACGVDIGLVDASEGANSEKWVLPGNVERQAVELAETARQGQIVLSTATRHQLGGEVRTVPITGGYLLDSIESIRAGILGRPLKRPTSFVGRSAEMAFLSKHSDELQSGSGKAVLLTGTAGIGKTRLVSEFLTSREAGAQRQIKLQCLPALSNSPLAPIRELCFWLCSSSKKTVLEDEIDAALLRELQQDRPAPEAVLQGLSDHQHRLRSYDLLNRMLASACQDLPLIVVFEDVHWIDATSREYLDAIIQDLGKMRLFVVMTSRPTDDPALTEAVLQLSPLGPKDSLKLLAESFDQSPVKGTFANRLVQRAAGNPFFIEELALAAQTGGDPESDLPDSIQAVIGLRISALSPQLRSMLYVLAVIGPPAPADLAGQLLGQQPEVTEEYLERLTRMGFIQAESLGYSFRHMLIHETAYSMVAPRERARLHKEIATYLENDAPSRKPHPETLAWHFQESGNPDKAVSYWKAASRDALNRQSLREAIAFARSGLALVGPEIPDAERRELELQLYLAPALTSLSGYGAQDVGKAYYRARELSRTAGTLKTEIRVLVGLWIHTWVRGSLAESMDHAESLLDLSKQVQDPALSLQAYAGAGQVLVHMGRFDSALDNLKLGLAAIGDDRPGTIPAQNAAVACSAYVCWANGLLGNRDEAFRSFEVTSSLSTALKNPFAEAIHYALCSEPFMFLGDVERCLDCADRAIAVSREHDFVFWLGTGLVMRGWAKGQLGEFDAAFAAIDEGISVFEGAGAGVQLANWYGLKAETLLAAGLLDAGLEAASHALACAEKAEDLFFVPRIHATMARLYEETGDHARATAHQNRATSMAKKFGMASDFVCKPANT